MSNRPWGIYLLSLVNLLVGLLAYVGTLIFICFWDISFTDMAFLAWEMGTALVVMGIGALFLDTAYASFCLKKRARLENNVTAVFILLDSIFLLFLTSQTPAGMYTSGHRPPLNVYFYLLGVMFSVWCLWYVNRSKIRLLFKTA